MLLFKWFISLYCYTVLNNDILGNIIIKYQMKYTQDLLQSFEIGLFYFKKKNNKECLRQRLFLNIIFF